MDSYAIIQKEAAKALDSPTYMNILLEKHATISREINKEMIAFKREGHFMGKDYRNKYVTEVFVPLDSKKYKGVRELKTIMLDHRITMKFIHDRKMRSKVIKDEEHIDHDFAKLALKCIELINISRVLKLIEIEKGEVLRDSVFSMKHDDDRVEFY